MTFTRRFVPLDESGNGSVGGASACQATAIVAEVKKKLGIE
jgi:hypothetical protein